jgi:hypothetical protein
MPVSPRDAPLPLPAAARTGPLRIAPLVVAVLVAAGFLLALLSATQGRFVPQVVDLYVVCQYARAMAEGHPFQYNPGDPASTGSTSLLYTAWLALGHAVGARGEALVAVAIGTGALLYLGSVSLAQRIAERLGTPQEAQIAATLVSLSGPVVWSFLYGSDMALFLFLVLVLVDRWLAAAETGRFGGAAVAATLLALARPEGLPLAAGLALAAALGRSRAPRRERSLMLVPVGAGLAVAALYRALTGSWLGSSIADKSLLANYPFVEALALPAEYVTDLVRGVLFGFYPSQTPLGFARGFAPFYLPPLTLPLALWFLAQAREPSRRPLQHLVLISGFVALLSGANMFMGVHFNRYVIWTFPLLLVLAVLGLGMVCRRAWPDPARARSAFGAAAGAFLALGLLSTLRFASVYAEMGGEVARRELPMAEWIRQNLPPSVRIANAATSVEYLTGHWNVNLHGVTSPDFFGGRTAEREGAMLEAMGRLEAPGRPAYLLTSDTTQAGSDLLRELAVGEPLFRTTSLGPELALFRLSFDLADRAASFWSPAAAAAAAGHEEVDRLNVVDGPDERAHAYGFESRLANLHLNGSVRIDDHVLPDGRRVRLADAGRAILGHERFHVRTRSGRALLVVMRTAGDVEVALLRASGSARQRLELPSGGFDVTASGRRLGRVSTRPGTGWNDVVFEVPPSAVGEGHTELTLAGRYASFRYWFFQ